MEFSELELHPNLRRGIMDAGYVHCMPVQEQVLANAFRGQDLYVQSQTGTGKTAAFLIVIFQRLLTESLLGGKKAIIMVPTRELAVQVEEEAKVLGKHLPFKAGSFYGGVGYSQQQRLLRDNVQILVGTPGRVLDLNKSGQMNLMDIAFLVLDEADRMFDMGFYPDLRKLIRVIPPVDRRQTMLFSATLNAYVKNLAWEYTKNPFEIEIEPETVTLDEVEQVLYHVPSNSKMKMLLGVIKNEKPESAIIFCNTKRQAEIVAKRLRVNGCECEFIIGDLPQSKRLKIIEDVKAGKICYLVATDVAARGLDIQNLSLVVNYDIPAEAENYVHRIGRTARAGKTGKAITLASEKDVYGLPSIERYIGKKIPSQIAHETLFAEDKSEGLRVRTDFYDDRSSRRPGRNNGGRAYGETGRGRGAGGRSAGSQAYSETARDGQSAESSGGRSGETGARGRNSAETRRGGRTGGRRAESGGDQAYARGRRGGGRSAESGQARGGRSGDRSAEGADGQARGDRSAESAGSRSRGGRSASGRAESGSQAYGATRGGRSGDRSVESAGSRGQSAGERTASGSQARGGRSASGRAESGGETRRGQSGTHGRSRGKAPFPAKDGRNGRESERIDRGGQEHEKDRTPQKNKSIVGRLIGFFKKKK
ncbi:MAG: DEAD/DEAH box helicase [Treponema sp.]|jgi:ATP-dependent RNA helicase RhlB|nr:DEAD/DEAH box helicase [Treponema sp.]